MHDLLPHQQKYLSQNSPLALCYCLFQKVALAIIDSSQPLIQHSNIASSSPVLFLFRRCYQNATSEPPANIIADIIRTPYPKQKQNVVNLLGHHQRLIRIF